MKFNTVPWEPVPWAKLWPENLVEGHILTTFRGYTPRNYWQFGKRVDEKAVTQIIQESIGVLGKAEFISAERMDSSELSLKQIRADTYPWYTIENWHGLMKFYYHAEVIHGVLITMKIVEAKKAARYTVAKLLRENSDYLDKKIPEVPA